MRWDFFAGTTLTVGQIAGQVELEDGAFGHEL